MAELQGQRGGGNVTKSSFRLAAHSALLLHHSGLGHSSLVFCPQSGDGEVSYGFVLTLMFLITLEK